MIKIIFQKYIKQLPLFRSIYQLKIFYYIIFMQTTSKIKKINKQPNYLLEQIKTGVKSLLDNLNLLFQQNDIQRRLQSHYDTILRIIIPVQLLSTYQENLTYPNDSKQISIELNVKQLYQHPPQQQYLLQPQNTIIIDKSYEPQKPQSQLNRNKRSIKTKIIQKMSQITSKMNSPRKQKKRNFQDVSLTLEQQNQLIMWIEYQKSINKKIIQKIVIKQAKKYGRDRNFIPNKTWYKNFLLKYPVVKQMIQESVVGQSSNNRTSRRIIQKNYAVYNCQNDEQDETQKEDQAKQQIINKDRILDFQQVIEISDCSKSEEINDQKQNSLVQNLQKSEKCKPKKRNSSRQNFLQNRK